MMPAFIAAQSALVGVLVLDTRPGLLFASPLGKPLIELAFDRAQLRRLPGQTQVAVVHPLRDLLAHPSTGESRSQGTLRLAVGRRRRGRRRRPAGAPW